ncbi:olfactory receptor 14J1-like [Tachyglossus aculeatus]|uniref:olfactory receptor 14J1-like n=1 Tax=Tachyglossus aculeatus TaxID=9261 RepID=UPI0018F2D208|nr:olfactory receptor 14J1-like [Tachyglossus aculeatus]
MANDMAVRDFLLLGFTEVRKLQLVYAVLFFLVYLEALIGNHLIDAITALDRRLHTSTLLPQPPVRTGQTFTSSFCVYNVIQQFFCDVPSLLKTSCSETHVVSRRVAVGIGFVFVSFISIVVSYVLIFSAAVNVNCRKMTDITINCPENHVAIDVSVSIGSCLGFVCLVYIIASYDSIFSTVPRIPLADCRSKAFSICLPHLLVVSMFLTTSAFDHLQPPSDTSPTLDLLVSVFYTVVHPDSSHHLQPEEPERDDHPGEDPWREWLPYLREHRHLLT